MKSIKFAVSTDAAGRKPLFAGRNSGRFTLGDYHALDGTHEAYFGFARRRLTPRTQAVAETLTAESESGSIPSTSTTCPVP